MANQDLDVKKILLIMPDDMVKKYKRRFLHEGFICKAVDSGFYALTMLEREKPSLIIATEDIEDLEVQDLLEIIDSDPDLADTRIIVLGEGVDTEANERFSTLSKESGFEDTLATAYQLLGIESDSIESEEAIDNNEEQPTNESIKSTGEAILVGRNTSVPSSATEGFAARDDNTDTGTDTRYDTSSAQITGELATDQLVGLINTFSVGSRGLLILRTSKADGRLLLEHERLLKAEYNDNEGKEAFDSLLYDALNQDKVNYFFQRYNNTSSGKGSKGKGVALSYLLQIAGQTVNS